MNNAEYLRCIRRMIQECNEMHKNFIAEYDPRDSGAVNINTFHVIMFPRQIFDGAGYELFITVPELNSKDDVDDISIMFKKNLFHPLVRKEYPYDMCITIKTSQLLKLKNPLDHIMSTVINAFTRFGSRITEVALNAEAASEFSNTQTKKKAIDKLISQGVLYDK